MLAFRRTCSSIRGVRTPRSRLGGLWKKIWERALDLLLGFEFDRLFRIIMIMSEMFVA